MISNVFEDLASRIKQLAERVAKIERLDRPSGGSTYTLPTATASVLGGVKVGSRLSIASGVLSADVQGGGAVIRNTKGGLTIAAGTSFVVSDDFEVLNGEELAIESDGFMEVL
ncbi:MAG: hypothetical protein CVU42_13910 [Chloroflexi bacterium HGW-Chloroflexi-4]|jgi:outer membrane protein assembly factor BamB|nr:MAG: hypothetical protein CVU42_13910 [Chloroflexi bacterium HGW-Chloroflexi-4]